MHEKVDDLISFLEDRHFYALEHMLLGVADLLFSLEDDKIWKRIEILSKEAPGVYHRDFYLKLLEIKNSEKN